MVIKVHTGWEKGNFCKEQAKISSSLMLVHLPGSLLVDHEVQERGGKASQSIPWQKERLSSKIQKNKAGGVVFRLLFKSQFIPKDRATTGSTAEQRQQHLLNIHPDGFAVQLLSKTAGRTRKSPTGMQLCLPQIGPLQFI